MRIETDVKLDFKDVLIRPKRSTLKSRSEVELLRTFKFKHSGREWTGVPIISANMDTSGTFGVASVLAKHKCLTALNKFEKPATFEAFLKEHPAAADHIAVSAGTSDADFENVSAVLKTNPGINFICLDVANGYSEYFVDAVKRYRAAFPDKTLIAGNVVTGEMTEELILAGADIVKVGIGPGSVCTTRRQTGVGYPQLSAIIECSDAAHGLGGMVIGDGGITCPGDVAKALGAGGDFVMLGGMMAGHTESGGELVTKPDGKMVKLFYGMSSSTAMVKHVGKVAEYRSSEGRTVELPYRGPLEPTVLDLLGGLRSACTYVGAAFLKELPKRTTFIRVTAQLNESYSSLTIATHHGYAPTATATTPASVGAAAAGAGSAGSAVKVDGALEFTKVSVGGPAASVADGVPVDTPVASRS